MKIGSLLAKSSHRNVTIIHDYCLYVLRLIFLVHIGISILPEHLLTVIVYEDRVPVSQKFPQKCYYYT